MELFYIYAIIAILVAVIETACFDKLVKHQLKHTSIKSHRAACFSIAQGIVIIALIPGLNLLHLVMRIVSFFLVVEKK